MFPNWADARGRRRFPNRTIWCAGLWPGCDLRTKRRQKMLKKTDGQLQRDVMEELEWEPSVDHADIGVAVTDGVVTLAGYVKTYPEKIAAEKATRRVAGVRAIAEEIKVHFASEPEMADHEIARRLLDMMAWTVSIPTDRVQVKVERGRVTLSGTVDWDYQRKEAFRAASRVTGVAGVSNLI